MTRTNSVLSDSLNLLYEYSGNFHISIGLIQKLSQQLRLETFVDKLDINGIKNQGSRLTIAGSTILIDIDFSSNNVVTNVSLSLANQSESNSKQLSTSADFISKTIVTDDLTRISIDWNANLYSFLKQAAEKRSENGTSSASNSVAEQILLSNLTEQRLNQFPSNLQYLARIDRLSCTNCDLFVFIEKLALIFKSINILEGIYEQDNDWQIAEGYATIIGKMQLNNEITNQLGLFINYWQDFRFINHQYQQIKQTNDLLVGKNHSILISIEPTNNDQPINYLSRDIWKLSTGNYDFQLDSPSSALPIHSWILNLNFNHSVWLPTFLLKYFTWSYTIDKNPNETENQVYGEIFNNTNRELVKQFDNIEFTIIQDFSLDKFVPVKSIGIKKLSDLTNIIPILRNFILLTNILITSLQSCTEIEQLKTTTSRRNSKVFPGELTEEARKKLKESLKLPDDVTDEELLGLNVINDSATYSTIGTKRDDVDLETFMNEPTEKTSLSKSSPYIQFTIDNFDFVTNELSLVIEGYLSQEIYFPFKITNGIISKQSDENSMEVDNDNTTRFIKGLKLTEDVYKTIKHIYN